MTGNRPKGFHPDDKQGNMFTKKDWGLHVPAEEEFDAQNETHIITKGKNTTAGPGDMWFKGYQSIPLSKIPPAVQDQYNDAGKVKPTHPSASATGYNKKRYGRQKKSGY